MVRENLIDLDITQLKLLKKIIRACIPGKTVWAYGSRVTWRAEDSSDLDLAVFDCNNRQIGNLTEALEESNLLISVDVLDWENIPEDFKTNIQKKYVVLQEGGESAKLTAISQSQDCRNWRTVKLGDVADINPSEQLPLNSMAKKVLMNDLIPFKKKITNYENAIYKNGSKFRNGDTLLARITPCLENGKTAFVDFLKTEELGFGSTEFIVIRPKKNILEKNYLFYMAISPYFRDSAIKSMTGSSGRQRVQIDELLKLKTSIPFLSEQKAIAEVLCSLDDKVECLHRQNKTLESMAETLFHQWFIKSANSSHWQKKPLGEWLETIESGSRPKGGIDLSLKKGVPSIGAESINGIGRFDFSKTKYVTEEFFKKMKKGIIKDYDTLIYKDGAYIGKKAMFGHRFPFIKMAVNEHVFILRSNSSTNPFFLYFSLEQNRISKLNANSAQPGLNQQAVQSLKITIPPKEDMNNFGLAVKPWIDKILFNSQQIRSLENIRDILLPKLMNGQARVIYPN